MGSCIGSLASLSSSSCGIGGETDSNCQKRARPGLQRTSSLTEPRDRKSGSRVLGDSTGCGRSHWSSEESGFAEPDSDEHMGCLSPVQELREKEGSDQSMNSSVGGTPRHISSSTSNLLEARHRRHSTEGLNSLLDTDDIDDVNGNGVCVQIEATHNQSVIQNSKNSCERPKQLDQETNANIGNTTNLSDSQNGNTPSALFQRQDKSMSPASRQVMNIGEKISLKKYCEREWRGETTKAKKIREGYSVIPEEVGLTSLRCIRGDQYCGVRAALFQALACGHQLPRGAGSFSRLLTEVRSGASWILEWTFAHRIHYGNVIDGIRDCLETLDTVSDNLVGSEDREEALEQLLNSAPRVDLQLCEAVKLHMLATALQLHRVVTSGGNAPLFAMIMFARESSQTPADFMRNHLNVVGDSGGLEQIEMFLLGHCLKATLQVVRPASYCAEDFICYYPDTNIGVWPQLTLIAEDDRHYNVIVE